MPAKPGASAQPARGSTGPWTAALRDAFPEVTWIDSDLSIGDGRRVDWVGVDPSGRIVFASRCAGDGEEPVVFAVDVLVFFERNRSAIARHLDARTVRPELDPLIALVAENFTERLLARFAGLGARAPKLFEVRELSSTRGERAYLVPVPASFGRVELPVQRTPSAFLAELGEGVRPLAELSIQRLSRIDDKLSLVCGERTLSWRFGDALLCSIAEVGGRLEGQVHGGASEPRALALGGDVEDFVDRVLGRYVELLGSEPMTEPSDSPMLVAVDAGMTLTAEEIAAFRQSG